MATISLTPTVFTFHSNPTRRLHSSRKTLPKVDLSYMLEPSYAGTSSSSYTPSSHQGIYMDEDGRMHHPEYKLFKRAAVEQEERTPIAEEPLDVWVGESIYTRRGSSATTSSASGSGSAGSYSAYNSPSRIPSSLPAFQEDFVYPSSSNTSTHSASPKSKRRSFLCPRSRRSSLDTSSALEAEREEEEEDRFYYNGNESFDLDHSMLDIPPSPIDEEGEHEMTYSYQGTEAHHDEYVFSSFSSSRTRTDKHLSTSPTHLDALKKEWASLRLSVTFSVFRARRRIKEALHSQPKSGSGSRSSSLERR